MNASDFRIELADYAEHLADLRAVREPVFILEQGCPIELEWDELDPQSVHALARDAAGAPIGTARLTPLPTIGRMAVLAPWRGRGVGAALLQYLIDHARKLGHASLELHAQTHAIGFYERFGFIAFGPEYDEAGIPHRSMRLAHLFWLPVNIIGCVMIGKAYYVKALAEAWSVRVGVGAFAPRLRA